MSLFHHKPDQRTNEDVFLAYYSRLLASTPKHAPGNDRFRLTRRAAHRAADSPLHPRGMGSANSQAAEPWPT